MFAFAMAKPTSDRTLPAGTVTFLFSDIEGSTRLWETRHQAMQLALARHDAILRDAIAANGGRLVKTTGDGAYAAFAVAADAVATCIAAQRALAVPAPDELRIKSRMAIHCGAADQRDGDYFGPAVNRAARLMAAGHGGQVLLSLAAMERVRDQLPAEASLRDLGERRLKDLIRPERVFQLVVPDLPSEFPPLKTLDARPNNLPAQATPFIGREGAVRAAKSHLSNARVRLLTLSGVGGTGKTRLALQVAADLVDEFEHGVYFIPLAALAESDLVLPAIAQALDVRESAGSPLLARLREHLRDRQMLLVLDNFEQVVDAAPLVSEILSSAPHLKILVTSREVLRISGEVDFAVPPLTLPDPNHLPPLDQLTQYESVALFIDRALAVKQDFAVTNDNAPAVAQICHQLDGLPLAIELAAARVRVLPPQKMLPALSHRLEFVTGGARDLPARQKTLRGAIDWSHSLLTDDEQKLFRRMAVFVGGCALDAVESVCNAEGALQVLDVLDSLAGKSLLKQADLDGEPRFSMLETIREYAAVRLTASSESKCLRQRHRDYFLALAEDAEPRLLGAEQAQWLQRLEADHENLRAALHWDHANHYIGGVLQLCGALQRFWWTRGHLTEGRDWCDRALAEAGNEEQTKAYAKVLNAAGALAYYQGDYPTARIRYEQSLAKMRQLGDRFGVAAALNNLGNVHYEEGDYAAARACREEALALHRELGDRNGIAIALNNLANVTAEQGDYAAAQSLLEECLTIDRVLGDQGGIAISLNNLGDYASEQGHLAKARTLYEESLSIKRMLGDRGAIAITLNGLGNAVLEQGDPSHAFALFDESLAIRRTLGDRRGIAYSLEGLAAVAAARRRPLDAIHLWGAADHLRKLIGAPLPPNERPRYQRRVCGARAELGDDDAFERAWAEGFDSALEQAIEFATAQAAGGG